MKLRLNVNQVLYPPATSKFVMRRTEVSLRRVRDDLVEMSLSLWPKPAQSGCGEHSVCTVVAITNDGTKIDVRATDPSPLGATNAALRVFERDVMRSLRFDATAAQ